MALIEITTETVIKALHYYKSLYSFLAHTKKSFFEAAQLIEIRDNFSKNSSKHHSSAKRNSFRLRKKIINVLK